jgi:hypothetical protein
MTSEISRTVPGALILVILAVWEGTAAGAVETGWSAAKAHAKRRKVNPAAKSIKRFIF